MAARSIASLTISFGLVSIPVKLYSATEASRAISFNLLHKTCGSRLKQQYLCVKEEVPVAREDMVKGYEFAKDQYVMFTPEELKALEEAGTHTADITEFVPIESIDPVYFDKAYYLGPDKGGAKPYALLARALRESERCALGRWAARGKQYIVMIRPVDGGAAGDAAAALRRRSALDQGHRHPEDRSARTPSSKLAQQLIEQQASDTFDPGAYTDEVRDADRGRGAEEGRGPGDHDGRGARGGAQVIDLMEALRASLEKKAPAARRRPTEPARTQAAKRAEPAAARRRARPPRNSRCEAVRTACATSRGCCACRAARSAR